MEFRDIKQERLVLSNAYRERIGLLLGQVGCTSWIYRTYRDLVLKAAGSNLKQYIDIHGYNTHTSILLKLFQESVPFLVRDLDRDVPQRRGPHQPSPEVGLEAN
jgi:hypothetical protein